MQLFGGRAELSEVLLAVGVYEGDDLPSRWAYWAEIETPLELVLSADDLLSSGVLDDPAVQARLMPLLPEEQRNPSELRSLVRSPQFQQARAGTCARASGTS